MSDRVLHYISLILLAFALAWGGMAWQYQQALEENITFSEKERLGLEYHQQLIPLLGALQVYRGSLNSVLHGEQRLAVVQQQAKRKILALIPDIDALDARVSPSLLTTEHWYLFKKKLLAELARDMDTSFDRYSELVTELMLLMTYIGDESNLILDPELESYYLMYANISVIPELSEALGQTRGLASGYIALTRVITLQQKKNILSELGVIHSLQLKLVHTYDVLQRKTGGRWKDVLTSKAHADQVAENFKQALAAVEVGEYPQLDSLYLFEVGSAAIGAYIQLYGKNAYYLDQLLEQRIQRTQLQKTQLQILTLFVWLSAYVFYMAFRHFYFKKQSAERELRAIKETLEQDVKQQTQELRHIKDYLQAVITNTLDGMVLTDHQGRVQQFNRSAELIFGYSEQQMLETGFQKLLVDHAAAEYVSILEQLIRKSEIYGINREMLAKKHNGECFDLELGVSCFYQNEQPIMIHVAKDISQRKRAERALARLSSEMEQILNTTQDGIYGLDLNGYTTFANDAACRLVGFSREEMLGQLQHSLIHHTLPDGRPYLREHCKIYAAFAQGVTGRVDNEVFWHKNGHSFPVEYTSTPIKNAQGEIAGAVVVFRDITEKKREAQMLLDYTEKLEVQRAELLIAKQRAEEVSQLKTEFLSNVSHELRTPMNAILGFSRQCIQRIDQWPQAKILDKLGAINRSGERLLIMLNDLLDLSKLEAGAMPLDKTPLSLVSLVYACWQEMESLIAEKQLILRFKDDDDLPDVVADRTRINQVLLNLLSNAIKFTPEKGEIDIQIKLDANFLLCCIDDDGPGIPEDEFEAVFDKFVQSSKTKTGAGGTGLGLAICREIIEAHQGKIWVEKSQYHGARFVFSLPLAQDS